MAISLSGLASGVDSSAIIEQLMQIDAQSKSRLRLRQDVLEARKQALTDVKTRLSNLLTSAKELGTGTAWADTQTLDVSDATKLSAKLLSGAAPGGHEISVSNLARSEQRTYAYTPGTATTLSIAVSGGATTNISVAAEDDGKAVADKINASPGAPVYAVWVKDPLGVAANDRLVLTRKDTGEFVQGDLTVSAGAGLGTETYRAGVDASYTVDGTPGSSRSNVLTAAVPGLQLTLKATGTTSVTVGAPGPDPEAVKAKVKALVSQYNSTVDFIRTKLTEKKIPNASTTADASKGVLFADTQLNGVLSQLRNLVSDALPGMSGAITKLGDIGVTTGSATGGQSSADALAGKLTLDEAKLTDALTNNRLDVKAFLTDTSSGISQRLTSLLDPIAKVGGVVDTRATQTGSQASSIDGQLAQMDTRLEAKTARLKAQFAAMESALARSQSTSSWLSSQLAGL
jgi:flagellar hook-associated protein 2